MPHRWFPVRPLLALILLSSIPSGSVRAQDPPTDEATPAAPEATAGADDGETPEAPDAGVPAEDLPESLRKALASRQRISEKAAEIRELEERAEAASPSDRRALAPRIADAELEVLDDLHELAASMATLEAEAEGEASAELRTWLESAMIRVVDELERIIAETRDQLSDLRQELDALEGETGAADETASGRTVPAVIQDIDLAWERLDRLYQAFRRHLDRMKELGIDRTSARRFLVESLEDRAATLAARIELVRTRIELLQGKQGDGSAKDGADAPELATQKRRRDGLVTQLRSVIELLDGLDRDVATYRTLLFDSTGEVTTDLLDSEVAASLTQRWMDQAWDWLVSEGPSVLVKLLVFLLIVVVARILAGAARRLVRKALARSPTRSQLLLDTSVNLAGAFVLGLGLLVAFSQVGVEIGPLLAGLGIAGFVIGFALQDVIGSFAAGTMILVYGPFDIGDTVEVGGAFGKVHKMNLVSTTLLTFDNQTIIVPNKKIWGEVIKNLTDEPIRRVDMIFGVSYGEDIPHVEQVIQEVLDAEERVLKEPAPLIKVDSLGDSSVNFAVKPWVQTADYWGTYWSLNREMFIAFGKAGITIPFPQRDVHIDGALGAPRAPARDRGGNAEPGPAPPDAGTAPGGGTGQETDADVGDRGD